MKAILIALSFSTLSFAAAASEVTTFEDHFVAMKSRAEVRAEVQAALARGERLSYGEVDTRDRAFDARSTKTRMDVIADLLDARAKGHLPPAGEA